VNAEPADLDKWTYVKVRATDDLPIGIKGKARWTTYLDTRRNSYEVEVEPDQWIAVEFLNDRKWYQLLYLREQAQFFTKASYLLDTRECNLGTHAKPYTQGKLLHEFYEEPVQTGPTERQEETGDLSPTESKLEQEVKGEPYTRYTEPSMGTQVAHVATAHVATGEASSSNQGAAGPPPFASAFASYRDRDPDPGPPDSGDPVGGRGGGGNHPGANPGGDPNPMPGGPPGGGGGFPPQNPMVAPNPQGGENGSLGGTAPTIFNGDRSRTEHFMREFELYRLINVNNRKITTPASRVALALSFIKGPKVDTWVFNQAKQLALRLYGDRNNPATHHPSNEVLWTDFIRDFKQAYTHTAAKETAYARLKVLKMEGDDIDGYIAKFEDLVAQAEWERTASGTVEVFKRGLPYWLAFRILNNRNFVPIGMEGWQHAAREEIERAALITATLGDRKKNNDGTRRNRFLSMVANQRAKRDPDAMDVDVNLAKTSQLSKQEREKLAKEGRCFHCKKQGHIARNCPDKPKRTTPFTQKNKGKQALGTKASLAEVVDDREDKDKEEESDEPPPYEDDKAILQKIRKLKADDREKFLDALADEDFC
jgi:hypothetical protein